VVSCDLVEEAALLNLKDGVYYGLNPVGARIWNLLQKPITAGEILEVIIEEYDVEKDIAQETFLFNDTIRNNLLVANPDDDEEMLLESLKLAICR